MSDKRGKDMYRTRVIFYDSIKVCVRVLGGGDVARVIIKKRSACFLIINV